MSMLSLERKLKEESVKRQKSYLRKAWVVFLLYPSLIAFCSVNLYQEPTHWQHALALGINIASGLFYLMIHICQIADYKRDCEMANFYKQMEIENEYENDN